MFVELVEMSNILSFREAKLALDPQVTLLVGRNDSGKTNVFRTIVAILGGTNERPSSLSKLESYRYSKNIQPKVSLKIHFDSSREGQTIIKLLRTELKVNPNVKSNWLNFEATPSSYKVRWGPAHNQVRKVSPDIGTNLLQSLIDVVLLPSDMPPLRPELKISEIMDQPNSLEAKMVRLAGLTIDQLEKLEKGAYWGYRTLADACQKITSSHLAAWIPQEQRGKQSFHIKLDGDNLVFCVADADGSPIPLSARGDGLRWFLTFLFAIRSEREEHEPLRLYLLDEPAINLHPSAQQALSELFHEDLAGRPNRQLIIATHSPFIADWSAPHEIRIVNWDSDSGTTINNRPYHSKASVVGFWEPFRSSLGLFLGDLGLLGDRNILVEGATDQIILNALSKHETRHGGPGLEIGETRILCYQNLKTLPLLALAAESQGREVVIICDSDMHARDARKIMRKFGCSSPLFTLAELEAKLAEPRAMTIEDVMLQETYLTFVNTYYQRFPWFKPISLSELSGPPIVEQLVRIFTERYNKEFSKAAVANWIASTIHDKTVGEITLRFPFARLVDRLTRPNDLIFVGAGTSNGEIEVLYFHLFWPSLRGDKLLTTIYTSDGKEVPVDVGWRRADKWENVEEKVLLQREDSFGMHLLLPVKALERLGLPKGTLRLTVMSGDKTIFSREAEFEWKIESPWQSFARRKPPGSRVRGFVTSISHSTPAGFWVQVDQSIEGFVHISRITKAGWIHDASEVVSERDRVEVEVYSVSAEYKRLELAWLKKLSEWADYCISSASWENPKRLLKVQVHKDEGDEIGNPEELKRRELLKCMEEEETFITIYTADEPEKWIRGEAVRVVTVDGEQFIRADDENIKADNLGKIPKY